MGHPEIFFPSCRRMKRRWAAYFAASYRGVWLKKCELSELSPPSSPPAGKVWLKKCELSELSPLPFGRGLLILCEMRFRRQIEGGGAPCGCMDVASDCAHGG